jgi:hypothetical protein
MARACRALLVRALLVGAQKYTTHITRTYETEEDLFYFTHISKAGGVSFIKDAGLSNLTRCTHHHQFDILCWGESYGPLTHQANDRNETGCNLISCEGSRPQHLKQLRDDLLPDVPIKELILVREPMQHMLSMYMMCQQTDASMNHNHISFSDWVNFAVARDEHAMAGACYYNPRNRQTIQLGAGYDQDEEPSIDQWLANAREAVENAAFVGITEFYALSICTLRARLGRDMLPECSCEAASAQLDALDAQGAALGSFMPRLPINHQTHDTDPSAIPITGTIFNGIGKLTSADRMLYASALIRFEADVREAGLDCWLAELGSTDPAYRSHGPRHHDRLKKKFNLTHHDEEAIGDDIDIDEDSMGMMEDSTSTGTQDDEQSTKTKRVRAKTTRIDAALAHALQPQ